MIKAKYFPTIVYAKDVNLDNRLFEKEVIDWSNKDKGIVRTNMNGWHSTTDMHEKPVFFGRRGSWRTGKKTPKLFHIT